MKEDLKTEETKVEETKVEETKKEDTKEETKVEEPEKNSEESVDVEALRNELAEANKKASEVEGLNTTIETLKQEVESKDSIIKEYEDLLGKMVETKMEQIPKDFADLVPENLDLKQKLSWLEKAEAKGLFNKAEKKKPNIEVGKPMNVENASVDTSKLNASQLMRLAYSSVKK